MSPKDPAFGSYSPPPPNASSLPVLVRMPDGERHQVDIAPTASVKDLKTSIAANFASWSTAQPAAQHAPPSPHPPDALAGWDLNFAGAVLNDDNNLTDYHIPDAYDHASGLLRTISDSVHVDASKKVEALDKACAVVAGISRGEQDMERLISAVFDDDETPSANPANSEDQPSLRALRRSRRSKIPPLNFAPLAPLPSAPGPASATKSPLSRAFPSAPPTPSQLIRKLSASRPDLYNPTVAAYTAPFQSPGGERKPGVSWFNAPPIPDTASASQGQTAPVASAASSGELKRGNTWFTNVFSAFGNAVPRKQERSYDGNGSSEGDEDNSDHDDLGDSEGEGDDVAAKNENSLPLSTANGEANVPNAGAAPGKTEPLGASVGNDRASGSGNGEKSAAAAAENGMTPPNSNIQSSGKSEQNDITSAVALAKAQDGAEGSPAGSMDGSSGAENVGSTATTPDEHTGANAGDEPEASDPGNPGDGGTGTTAIHSSGATAQKSEGTGPLGLDTSKQVIGLEPELPSPVEDVKQPKKRGRKRKNPHLSEEQRKAQRQAQNRESAKLSRIRRKNMTIEYEKRVNTLEGENENLRDTVAALTDRLEILQNLLTVDVMKRPSISSAVVSQPFGAPVVQGVPVGVMPGVPGVVPAPPPHALAMPQQVSGPLVLGTPQQQTHHHPHQVPNMQYKNY